jgi:hypothetical protein
MEKRLNKKAEEYVTTFKNNIKNKAESLGMNASNEMGDLLTFIYDYERLAFEKEDFSKRKRVKNIVPFFDRCCAKRASNEQCTRRKKEGCEYCGTHVKGTPHGIIDSQVDSAPSTQKVDVWAQEIMGIVYYLDKGGNVYQAEDIVSNKTNPKIIAKYVKNGDSYTIPEFGI